MIPITHFIIFTAILFLIGLYGVLTRRNLVAVLMSIELMLNAVNINFIAFSRLSPHEAAIGQIFVIFIITIAAAEATVALAIVVALFRNRRSILTDDVNLLKG
jgi:NADH-quinone oxidoreductase subunit K